MALPSYMFDPRFRGFRQVYVLSCDLNRTCPFASQWKFRVHTPKNPHKNILIFIIVIFDSIMRLVLKIYAFFLSRVNYLDP